MCQIYLNMKEAETISSFNSSIVQICMSFGTHSLVYTWASIDVYRGTDEADFELPWLNIVIERIWISILE